MQFQTNTSAVEEKNAACSLSFLFPAFGAEIAFVAQRRFKEGEDVFTTVTD